VPPPLVSVQFDDMRGAPVDGPKMDARWQPFVAWHDYLATTFPLVHQKMKLDKPNRFNLVFTLEGTHSKLKPLVLSQSSIGSIDNSKPR
jgi:hypothetical protein